MKLKEIKEILAASVLTQNCDMDINIYRVYSTDLMSDVLAFCDPNAMLITALTNAQVIRTAGFADIKTIVFVQGKNPNNEVITLSEEKKLPLLSTNLSMFEACGRLYEKGLRSCPDA